MTTFNHNFSKILLLANENIIFSDEGQELFELIPMKVKDLYLNKNVIWFLGFLEQDPKELNKYFNGIEIENHFRFIITVLTVAEKQKELKETAEFFIDSLNVFIPGTIFENKRLKFRNTVVTEEIFYLVVEVIYKILGKKEKIVINEDDDEMTKKMKETQKKIQNIKNKGRKINEDSTDFEDMFAALLYEFPQYKMKDLFELNIYTFYYLFKYVGKIANYEVSKIAAGNGLAKKHKYFIEK